MGVHASGDQLYMHVLMKILRGFQMRGEQPSLPEFIRTLESDVEFSKSQSGPLLQRLALLRYALCSILLFFFLFASY